MAIRTVAYLGDSLTDSDEFWSLSSRLLRTPLPDQDWYAHRFSDGRVHADLVPGLAGLAGGPAWNFAFAGAEAVGVQRLRGLVDDPSLLRVGLDHPGLRTDINLGAQTQRLLREVERAGGDFSTFAVNIWIGINDLADWEPESIWPWRWDDEIDDLVAEVAASIEASVIELAQAGAGAIRVLTLPDETFFPVASDLEWWMEYFADGVIDDFNARLGRMVEARAADGAPVELLDMQAITREIEADPSAFGFRTIEKPILLSSGLEYDPPRNPALGAGFRFPEDADEIGFIDQLHPTEALHGVLAAFEAEAMQSELHVFGGGADAARTGRGRDLVLLSDGPDTAALGRGSDVALGGRGDDRIGCGRGSDLASGGAGDDRLRGGAGADLLAGGRGDDRLHGGAGADALLDVGGSDILRGGPGDDWVLWIDPAARPGLDAGGSDALFGGRGRDSLVLWFADQSACDLALAEREDGRSFFLESFGISASGFDSVEFLALSDGFELPATGDRRLDELLAEADHWGFA